jgi:flagellar protein FlgJ
MPESTKILFAAPPNLPSTKRPHATALSPQQAPVDAELKNACEEMEALFLHHLLSEMRKSLPKAGLIDGGRAEEIYTSLMDAELAKQMAHTGGLGLSSMLLEQMRAVSSGPFRTKP